MKGNLIPLSVIAENVVSGDSNGKYKFNSLRYILEGYRKMHMFLSDAIEVKTQVLEVDNAIELPCDFIFETKVGIRRKGTQHIAMLTLDKSLGRHNLNDTDTKKYIDNIWEGSYIGDPYIFYNYVRGANFVGELYGYGRGVWNSGLYNIDKSKGLMYVGSLIREDTEVILEYKSDGLSDGLKLVPVEWEPSLNYFGKMKYYEDKGDLNKAVYFQSKYEIEYNIIKRLYNFRTALFMAANINESFSPTNY